MTAPELEPLDAAALLVQTRQFLPASDAAAVLVQLRRSVMALDGYCPVCGSRGVVDLEGRPVGDLCEHLDGLTVRRYGDLLWP